MTTAARQAARPPRTHLTRREVALLFGISQQRVDQIERRALWKLRQHPDMVALAAEYGIADEGDVT